MEVVRFSLIVAAAALLLVALFPVRRLLVGLPSGGLRHGWYWLSGLIVVMIGAELIYASNLHAELALPGELMMPVALLAGSWFVVLIAQLSAGSINDAHRLLRLELESVTDQLTGLYNRHYLQLRLAEEIPRARRQDSPLSLMLIDADHFKQINDRYGHREGDRALQHLAAIVRQESRGGDVVVRYGGEEILVLSAGGTLSQMRGQAERLRRRVAEQPLRLVGGGQHRLTVSIGVGQLDRLDHGDPQALIQRVDKALYQAKRLGRDRVEVALAASARDRVAYIRDWVARQRDAA